MSRLQLALNVDDLDAAIAFYTTLFDTAPAKTEPGYANFAVADPPLKLVLIENPGQGGSINHLGVEVEDVDRVDTELARLSAAGFATAEELRLGTAGLASTEERDQTCCYAKQTKFWVENAPNGERWEIYTVLGDSDVPHGELRTTDVCGAGACATTELAADQPRETVAGCC